MDKSLGRCVSCVKWLLFGINSIVSFAGFALLALSVWHFVLRSQRSPLLDLNDGKLSLTLVLFVTSLLLISVGFCGLFGAFRENRCLLATYFLFMLTSIALTIVGGVLANRLSSKPESILRNQILLYSRNPDATKLIDETQQSFKCCGIEDYNSWAAVPLPLPASCCIAPESITCQQVIGTSSSYGPIPNATDIIYTEGCATELGRSTIIKVTVPILIFVGVIDFFGVVLTLILCCTIGPSDSSDSKPLLPPSPRNVM